MNSYVNRYVYISYHRGENDKNLSAHSNLSNNHSPLKQDRTAALRWHHSDVKLSFCTNSAGEPALPEFTLHRPTCRMNRVKRNKRKKVKSPHFDLHDECCCNWRFTIDIWRLLLIAVAAAVEWNWGIWLLSKYSFVRALNLTKAMRWSSIMIRNKMFLPEISEMMAELKKQQWMPW